MLSNLAGSVGFEYCDVCSESVLDFYAAGRFCWAPALNSSIMARLNAGMSSGLRAVTKLPSVTASLSTHSAPALRISVLSEGHEAILRPRATPASMMVHGPWQM